ncbi:hypothetical protein HN51_037051 [Arachis hypogaea]|uniref:Uncharacterized protein n=1 Tax=Arachis hypogaea TaxID=3818 RepID=A0A444ZXS4_ARAHY|nr:uncharacterized protein LOC107634656 [Arachis ipaensis]XP_025637960.1 uncharacterized protein LOC112733272 [Arachis hypogaea]RYR18854.1 hypothetical protein Ahy_B03g063463 [Arachis hypogaea]
MSDIAMLVAEEYEKRTKILKKDSHGAVGDGDIIRVSGASVLASKLKEEKNRVLKWFSEFEPKSQFGVAASDSFFSA